MPPVDLESFRWLLSPAGQSTLARAVDLCAEGTDPIRAGEVLRRRVNPERAATAMTQATLRRRAVTKLGEDARRMYFTSEGLEQATRRDVAAHRAARVARASPGSVLDLGCGIGGDLVVLARAGAPAHGVDLDPLRAAVAEANLAALGLPGSVATADGTTLDLTRFGLVFLDPARRDDRRRIFDPDDTSPPWSFVEAVLTRPACVKAAPGLAHDRVPAGVEAEWVSVRGAVKEAALWSASLATTTRRATVIGTHGTATLTTEDDPGEARVRPPGRFLLEPDGAVIRAGLVTAVTALGDGWLLDPHIAYVSTDRPVATPYARGFEVLEELPFHEKRLKAALRERHVGRLTIKKRGVDVVPEQLRRRLALRGDQEATVVLTRARGRGVALLVRPLD